MDLPFLFAETPRAGRWNHRFLVPTDFSNTEEQLAEHAARARRQHCGADYLAVVREVEQPFSGRTADELLVLQGLAVEHLDAATRRILLQRLESRLDDLEQLVHAIDWQREGKRLVVRRQELDTWFDADVATELAACRGPAPLENREHSATNDWQRQRKWIVPLTGVAIVVIGLFAWQQRRDDNKRNDAQPSANARPAVAPWNESELREIEASLRALAEAWRMPQRRDPLPELCEAVVERVEQDLVLEPAMGSEPAQQRLPQMIASLAQSLMRGPAIEAMTFVEHLGDDGFKSRLLSIYRGKRLDYAAPLHQLTAPNDYDQQAQLRALAAICPADSKAAILEYRRMIEEARALTLDAFTAGSLQGDSTLVQHLHDAARSAATLHWPAVVPSQHIPMAVLDENDAAAAEVMVRWLARISSVDGIGIGEDAVVATAQRFISEKRDFLEALSKQHPPGDRVFAIRMARLLLQLDRLTSSVNPTN